MEGAVTTNENIIVDRDYTDNFSIKDTAMSKLGPKYFEGVDTTALNVGELGFVLEQVSNITEDSFNTASIWINESYPNKAVIPESILSHAAIFQIDNTFANCASCSFLILLQQKDVLTYGTVRNDLTTFYIDKKTVINIENIPFTFDYDIKIDAVKKYDGMGGYEYNYSAQYVIDYKNDISTINDPYLKIRKTSNGYLLLHVTMHQVQRTELVENIINNTKINFPVLTFPFDNYLAGFDIYYKAPTDTTYTQLLKRIKFSLPIKTPFCYYKLKDENTLEITFTTRDGYFMPAFNSEIKVVLYTTLGEAGNFEIYNGSNIPFEMFDDVYPYNTAITIATKTVSDCSGGTNKLSLEALQALTVESYTTASELSTENDIMTYFHNYKYRYGTEILVIKRRDDITERLFSAFLIIKHDNYIYPTNTLYLDIDESQFDISYENNRFTLKPGHVYTYKDGSNDTMVLIDEDVMAYDTEALNEIIKSGKYEFLYTNPFLISMTKIPNLVGIYKTVTSQTAILDYESSNDSSFTQFITSHITVTRGLSADASYNLSVSIVPSSSSDAYISNLNTYEGNDVRMIVGFVGTNSEESGYVELLPTYIDPNDPTAVTFSAKVTTNDYITSTKQIALTNVVKINEKSDYAYTFIEDAIVNVYILYNDGISTNKFTKYFEDIDLFAVTNIYSTKSDPITFIEPLNMMRSTVVFSNRGTNDEPIVHANLSLLPVIKADMITNTENFNTFVSRLTGSYNYLESCLSILRNNTHLDVKFYNTYGKSNNYHIGDYGELIDRVNMSIKFSVIVLDGTDEMTLRRDLKEFIKNFIEQVNSSGNNDLYISNLIKSIENNFPEIHHLKFLGINKYDTNYQTISSRVVNINNLSKDERRRYVPEILVIDPNDVELQIEVNRNDV